VFPAAVSKRGSAANAIAVFRIAGLLEKGKDINPA
jgi:hypothetical protein